MLFPYNYFLKKILTFSVQSHYCNVDDDEVALLAIVRERLANPQKGIKVSLDDL
ncbi:hypothetical protein [Aeromonas veronii]|uniref:hypothetical protein n=1 Tax=Aeromonas veronii TaxID=654 RepID=UPI003D1F08D0